MERGGWSRWRKRLPPGKWSPGDRRFIDWREWSLRRCSMAAVRCSWSVSFGHSFSAIPLPSRPDSHCPLYWPSPRCRLMIAPTASVAAVCRPRHFARIFLYSLDQGHRGMDRCRASLGNLAQDGWRGRLLCHLCHCRSAMPPPMRQRRRQPTSATLNPPLTTNSTAFSSRVRLSRHSFRGQSSLPHRPADWCPLFPHSLPRDTLRRRGEKILSGGRSCFPVRRRRAHYWPLYICSCAMRKSTKALLAWER